MVKKRRNLTKTVIEDERKKSKIRQKNPLKFSIAVTQLTARIAEHFFTCRKSDVDFNAPIISPAKEQMAKQIIFNLGEFLLEKDRKVIRRKSLEVIAQSPEKVKTIVIHTFGNVFRMPPQGENLEACKKIVEDLLQWKKIKKTIFQKS